MSNIDKLSDQKKDKKDKEKEIEKIWNESEVQLLKKWGEIASSYRLLHDRAFREFQIKSYGLTIPVIVMSTLSGTASFSISSFPTNLQLYVPMVIGGVNIFVGIIQTVTQFLRVNELTESHRVASITYGKFARNITTELSLPPNGRTYNGIDYVQMCRAEMDRMIEQSPIIPLHLLNEFDTNKKFLDITKPEVLTISNINVYQPSNDEKVAEIMANVADKIQNMHKQEKTVAQKIKEQIEKKVNPNIKEEIIPDEIKNFDLKDIEANFNNNKNINIDEITNNIINRRSTELKEIGSGGIVSKMLKKNVDEKIITPIKNINEIVKKNNNKDSIKLEETKDNKDNNTIDIV
jgi:hypothetical protein